MRENQSSRTASRQLIRGQGLAEHSLEGCSPSHPVRLFKKSPIVRLARPAANQLLSPRSFHPYRRGIQGYVRFGSDSEIKRDSAVRGWQDEEARRWKRHGRPAIREKDDDGKKGALPAARGVSPSRNQPHRYSRVSLCDTFQRCLQPLESHPRVALPLKVTAIAIPDASRSAIFIRRGRSVEKEARDRARVRE